MAASSWCRQTEAVHFVLLNPREYSRYHAAAILIERLQFYFALYSIRVNPSEFENYFWWRQSDGVIVCFAKKIIFMRDNISSISLSEGLTRDDAFQWQVFLNLFYTWRSLKEQIIIIKSLVSIRWFLVCDNSLKWSGFRFITIS